MPASELTAADRAQLSAQGLSPAEVARQVALLRQPPPPLRLLRPATLGDGIRDLAASDEPGLLAAADTAIAGGRLSKLVPASGAATRMFAAGLAVLAELRSGTHEAAIRARAAAGEQSAADTLELVAHLSELPFGPPARSASADLAATLAGLLEKPGLGLAERPKALLPFHRVGETARTPFEEHLAEAVALAEAAGGGTVGVHFTVSPEHQAAFAAQLAELQQRWRATGPAPVPPAVSFSSQSSATDTVALTAGGELARHGDGRLLLRPGGHGALLANLAASGGDLVLLKNIDNVQRPENLAPVVRWERLLVGLLAELAAKQGEHLRWLAAGPNSDQLTAAARFAASFGAIPPAGLTGEALRRWLHDRLDRPLRVCGMVENRAEPGGGPFWVESEEGPSLQIVEAAQLDPGDVGQRALFAASTHFNPVLLACALRDAEGKPRSLAPFVDPRTAFLATKTVAGQPLRVLEHPGLWNGAMARWLTCFLAVPRATFSPVKTALDLLSPEHRGA